MRRGASIRREAGSRWAAAAIAALAGVSGPAGAAGFEFKGYGAEASWTSDSDVNRAPSGDMLHDRILAVRVNASGAVPVSVHTRFVLQGFVGTQKFGKFTGLSSNTVGAQGDFSYRPSGEYGAPTYGAFVRLAQEAYESNLRDGYRNAYGLTVLKPATDRIVLSGAITLNTTDGKSTVFDTRNVSLRGNADWSLGRWDTVYLGADYRKGDSVSSVCRTCDLRLTSGLISTASAVTQDDAFNDNVRDAYRFKANTLIATLGYNHAFGEKQSVDVSWRRVQSQGLNPVSPATSSDISYSLNQFSIAYLARF